MVGAEGIEPSTFPMSRERSTDDLGAPISSMIGIAFAAVVNNN